MWIRFDIVTATAGKIERTCPACGRGRTVKQKKLKRYVYLRRCPLIPVKNLGGFSQCTVCNLAFDSTVSPKVVGELRRRQEARFHLALRKLMLIMLKAGESTPRSVDAFIEEYAHATGQDLKAEEVQEELRDMNALQMHPNMYVPGLPGEIDCKQKRTLMRGPWKVATAGGSLSKRQTDVLAYIASALELEPEEFRSLLKAS